MILAVTPNPALDETYDVERLAVGGTNRVAAPRTRAGGKGINVARILHGQGIDVHAVTTCGGVLGGAFAEDLASAGIGHTLVPAAAGTRRSFALVDQASGQTTIFNERGGRLSAAEGETLRQAITAAARSATVVVGSGSLPDGAGGDGFYPWLVGMAHDRGLPCLVDTSGPGLLAAADAGADLLKPNHHELLEATGLQGVATGAADLLARGARRVLVSSGEEGLALFDKATPGRWVSARLPGPLAGNPTGAGDACVAALAAGLHRGQMVPADLVRRAAAWSASAVLMPAAGELHPSHHAVAARVVVAHHDTPTAPHESAAPCP